MTREAVITMLAELIYSALCAAANANGGATTLAFRANSQTDQAFYLRTAEAVMDGLDTPLLIALVEACVCR